MKKYLLMVLGLLLSAVLIACDAEESGTKEKDNEKPQSESVDNGGENEEKGKENEPEEEGNDFVKEYDQTIVDDDEFKAVLTKVERKHDKDFDRDVLKVYFEVENKREDTIEVQAREVSADGKMVDDMILSMSQEVASGKLADAVLSFENYDGDLPSLEDNIEMILHVFSWDDYEFEKDTPLTIDLKK